MPQLDALRFFAVMGVIIVHNWQPSAHTLIVGQVDWGDLGVRLFFVLSGFLITGILIGGRELAPRDSRRRLVFMRQFYARRFLRIFPVYYAVLFALLLAGVGQIRDICRLGCSATRRTSMSGTTSRSRMPCRISGPWQSRNSST